MRCSTFREALSARLDGEDPGLPAGEVDAHLAGCADCRAWVEAAGALAAVVERAPRGEVGLDPALLAALTAPPDEARTGLLSTLEWRVLLGLVALAQLVVAWPGVLLHDGHASVHLAHELTAWDMGLAAGFLVAALRPARAWGMLPLAAVLVACMVVTSGVDTWSGHALLGRELVHALEVVGLGIVWILARRAPRPAVVVRLA
jgi:predicted anti-sigma-YlaC factor YlaD